jgi:type II secretory pathway component PulC
MSGAFPILASSLLAAATALPEVSLSGIVLSRSGRHAATLVSEGRVRSVTAGERAFGCEVRTIRMDAAEILCAGERRTLRLAAAPSREVSAPAPSRVEEAPADLTLSRADLEARLDREMSRLMTETTLVPVTARGAVAGFTITRVPAGTILETVGLKAGDVLVSVNDTPVDSFTTLVGLWPRLQSTGAVRAQILRDGRPMDLSVSIR